MLDKYKVIESLENKKNEFISFKDEHSDELNNLQALFEKLLKESSNNIINHLKENPGALPTNEWDNNPPVVNFKHKWHNHQQARQWAHDILLNKTTFSVDGSQVLPSKEITPAIGAVQVAKFENFHTPEGKYNKDIIFEVISTKELHSIEKSFSNLDHYINYKRFKLEVNTIINYIKENKNNNNKPIIFFDGSLIISFITAEGATGRNQELRDSYIYEIVELLNISETHQIPIIGYIDTSKAHDIVDMLKTYYKATAELGISDTNIIDKYLEWGDRCTVFHCKRPGVLNDYGDYGDKICFTYLKTNKNLSSRIEFPQWLWNNKKLFDEVINIIRAEIIIGNGYIYSIESADAVAAISGQDKKTFYQIYSEFAFKNNIGLNISQKQLSKKKRR